jgi:trans-AT polyketide synthase/acyltransferase/oxidoreductase domain-containing protein
MRQKYLLTLTKGAIMNKPIVFMFSGQGSQYFQMGKALYQSLVTFRHWMDRLDDDFYILTGTSVISHLYDENKKKGDPFDNFLFSHAALFMVEYALAQVLIMQI